MTTACRRFIAAAAAGLALALLASPEARAESPTDALRDFFDRVNKVLADPETEGQPTERLIAVRTLVNDVFDFRDAAELALGHEWQARTPAELEEFVQLFADLLGRAYVSRVASKADVNAGVKIRYLDESIGQNAATARTTVASRDGGEIPLDYRMNKRGERWMVRDVVIEGVSVVANYRAQFQRVIEGSSYGELVAQMRAKTTGPRVSTVTAEGALDAGASAAALDVTRVEFDEHATVNETQAGAEAAPSPTREAPAAAASYWVQVGAFKSPEAAGWLAARLHERNLVLSHGPALVLRVRIGPFSDRAKALAKLLELRAQGYQPFIAAGHE